MRRLFKPIRCRRFLWRILISGVTCRFALAPLPPCHATPCKPLDATEHHTALSLSLSLSPTHTHTLSLSLLLALPCLRPLPVRSLPRSPVQCRRPDLTTRAPSRSYQRTARNTYHTSPRCCCLPWRPRRWPRPRPMPMPMARCTRDTPPRK